MKGDKASHHPGRSGIGERVTRFISLGMLSLLAAVLVWSFFNWVSGASFTVQYPYQIDYGEGVVWQQALMILRGEGYSDITRLPFVVFHYPPVFHLLSGLFAGALGIEYLAAGRLVSAVSTLGSAVTIGVLIFGAVRTKEGLMPSLLCAFGAALIVFTFAPVKHWSPLMRVDMTALFLSFLGVYFGLQAPERPRYVYVSALFFLLALYTKQTAVAAPLATLLVLMVIRPRLAGAGFITALGFGLLTMLALQLSTDGRFIEHIIYYNINRIDFSLLKNIFKMAFQHLLYICIVIYFMVELFIDLSCKYYDYSWVKTLRTRALSDKLDRLCCFIFVYIFLTTLSLISVAKSGSSNSYFIEWVFAWSIVIGLFLRQLIKYALGSPGSAKGRNPARGMVGSCRPLSRFDYPVMLAVLLYQAWVISPPSYKKEITDVAHQEQQRELLRRVQDASKPVISDDMVAILNSGKEVVWEAAIFAELTALNLWDEGPFIQMIQSNDFAFFVTGGERGNPVFDSRYNAAVSEAIESAYPRTEPLAGYTIHLPPE
jgi:hypothetical protein